MTEETRTTLSPRDAAALARALRDEVHRVPVGQNELIERLVVGLLVDGHILLEGVPGLAKSLAVETLAQAVGGSYRRIQFTPDLLPTDLLGTHVYERPTATWVLREGPIFANLILADEINRAPAKVQSALLEAMQERTVSLGGESRSLPEPFMVLATQNPLEHEGTYPLPEAQLDRFLMKVVVTHPAREEEREIIERMAKTSERPYARAVTDPDAVLAARRAIDELHVDPRVVDYVLDIVHATRRPSEIGLDDLDVLVTHGASPRASIGLVRAARAMACLDDRDFVTPHDVKVVAPDILRHRVLTSFEALARGLSSDEIVTRVLESVRVP